MSECCHIEARLGEYAVLHICNRAKGHKPPCVFELFKKDVPVEPDWTILRASRDGAPIAILGLPIQSSPHPFACGCLECAEKHRAVCPPCAESAKEP